MVRIRLARAGSRKAPSYRVVAADSCSPRDGRFIEAFGRYDPMREPELFIFDRQRLAYWLGVGARPSKAVESLLRRAEKRDRAL